MNDEYESKLWKVLEKEGLADLSQYHRPGFYEEVPFYSRASDVSFLSDLDRDGADSALLRFGLKFLRALIWYEVPSRPFFAALTVWHNPDDEWIVPYLFVCSGNVQEQIGEHLELHAVEAAPSVRIKKLLSRIHLVDSI